MIGPESAGRSVAKFPPTHWSCVVAAGGAAAPEARRALEELCAVYWYPLYAFIRRQGHDPGTAEDLVQGFFTTLLERDSLSSIDRAKGRFRSFLMAACTHYLANGRERERTLKRGRGQVVIPIDALDAEERYRLEPAHELTAERLFERRWVLTLLDHVLDRLAAETSQSGKSRLFEALEPSLLGKAEKR